jgi:hypothetical protein
MKTKILILVLSLSFVSLHFFGQGIIIQPNAYLTLKGSAHIKTTSTAGLTIKSTASGTGSVIDETSGISISGTTKVERYIVNDVKWHFLSSPVAAQPIWPEFAPTPPTGSDYLTYSWGTAPWGWDFYYWNPMADTNNQLYWVNLRNTDGSYNYRTIDGSGSEGGYGTTTPPSFTAGRGYLVAYNTGWGTTHSFTGTLNSGTFVKAVLTNANSFNLVGNPYPSAIDWKASGWTRSILASSGSGYDYWIFSNTAGNYGVYNSGDAGETGTNGTSRYIAPMQGFFVKASSAGNLTMANVQVHSTQSWLKEVADAEISLRVKLTTSANSFCDEMIVAVNSAYETGGSQKFWSMFTEAPELYSIKGSSNYSIDRLASVNENSFVTIGIKAGLDAGYSLNFTGVDNFSLAKSILLEDLKTGTNQDLKTNPSYSFSADPGDDPERFHLHFSGPFGIIDQPSQPDFIIYSSNHTVYVKNISGKNAIGDIFICNLLGQKTAERRITDQNTIIGLDEPAGCYIVTLVTNSQTYSRKVFIH